MNMNETKRKMKYSFLGIVCVIALGIASLYSCSKDKDKNGSDGDDLQELTIDPTSVSVKVGATASVAIKTGNGDYKATVNNTAIASVTVNGSTIEIKGLTKGSANITIADKANKSAQIAVTVTEEDNGGGDGEDPTGVAMNTAVKYKMEFLSDEKGEGWYSVPGTQENIIMISGADYTNNVNVGGLDDDAYGSLGEFFDLAKNPNIFVTAGYAADAPAMDYGYAAPAFLLTDEGDPDHPGMKKVQVITTNLAAYCEWPGYTSNERSSSAFYDPATKSLTFKVSGYLGWGFSFTYHRKLTPMN